MQVQKLGGGTPPKNLGAKNMQNFGQFWNTSDFDREYLRNGSRYPKSADVTNYGNSSCVWRKKSCELWSTNGLELHVSLDPLKCTFLTYYISALRRCCVLKFLHALEIDQALLAHTPTGTGVPQKIFNRENLNFGLKFSVMNYGPHTKKLLTYPTCTYTVSWRKFIRHVVLGYSLRSHSPAAIAARRILNA